MALRKPRRLQMNKTFYRKELLEHEREGVNGHCSQTQNES